jgi:hypothetical protein
MPDGRILLATFREQADRLLGPEISDADGNREDRRHRCRSSMDRSRDSFQSAFEESQAIGGWLRSLADQGIQAHEIGVFVRSTAQVSRATAAAGAAGLPARVLDDRVDIKAGSVNSLPRT